LSILVCNFFQLNSFAPQNPLFVSCCSSQCFASGFRRFPWMSAGPLADLVHTYQLPLVLYGAPKVSARMVHTFPNNPSPLRVTLRTGCSHFCVLSLISELPHALSSIFFFFLTAILVMAMFCPNRVLPFPPFYTSTYSAPRLRSGPTGCRPGFSPFTPVQRDA